MKRFEAKKIERSHTVHLNGKPETIFPLLCPVREEDWIPGWENNTYELVYSHSGYNEEGCIFKTNFLYGSESLWTTIFFDEKDFKVEFLVNVKERMIYRLSISLQRVGTLESTGTFKYVYTATNESGNEFIDGFTQDACINTTVHFEQMINHYLQTGKKHHPEAMPSSFD
jgi:hypothetical protein